MAGLAVATASALADERSTTQPAGPVPRNNWDASWFSYERAQGAKLVEETTPSRVQLDFYGRPPQLVDGTVPLEANAAGSAEPATVGSLKVLHLRFKDAQGSDVPCLLAMPKDADGPFPVAIAVHGLGSNKAQAIGRMAPAMARHGFAVLALDLPRHGERPGQPRDLWDIRHFGEVVEMCHQAVMDVRECIDLAEQRPELDTKHGVVLMGYSLGAIIDSLAGPVDDRVKAMVLMVGGTIEFPPMVSMVPQLIAMQPQMAIPHFSGRPVLMLNGKHDEIIRPEMGQRLFAAAAQPKEQVWYDSGHFLPEKAYEDAAGWVARLWAKAGRG